MNKIPLTDREKPLVIPGEATTIPYGSRGLNWKGKVEYYGQIAGHFIKINRFYKQAIKEGECYYGPFVGEFGHFLLHNLPFLAHLNKRGVKIHYCGMDLHRPFLVDENDKPIIESYTVLRDFFSESKPVANETTVPKDVLGEIDNFKLKAKRSGFPFLDISEKDMYWYTFRNWQLKGRQSKFELDRLFEEPKSRSAVIFPRKKGGDFTPNNGGPWNYNDVAKILSPYFDKVYLVGHPSLSDDVQTVGNIEMKVSQDNRETMKYCAQAELIVTQHSGAVHIGAYVNTPVLIIFNGQPPIKGLIDTIRFRQNISNQPLNYAFNLEEIENFAHSYQK
mgnify:CR=1 FL=1